MLLLEEANQDLLLGLVKAIEARGPYTATHVLRAHSLSEKVGSAMGHGSQDEAACGVCIKALAGGAACFLNGIRPRSK